MGETVTLEFKQWVLKLFKSSGLSPIDLEVALRSVQGNVEAELSFFFLGKTKQIEGSKFIKVPANWWEHLKQRLGFKYKEKTIDVKCTTEIINICPHLPEVKLSSHVVFPINPELSEKIKHEHPRSSYKDWPNSLGEK